MKVDLRYLLIIVGLLVVNLFIYFSNSSPAGTSAKNYFNIDTAQIAKIELNHGEKVVLSKKNGVWKVNDKYKVDGRFMNTLLTLLQKVEVKRSLGAWEGETLGEVNVVGERNFSFQFAANPNKTKTFFIQNDRAKEVQVSGYRDQITSILLLHPDQWRDRLIVNGSWRSIQSLSLEVKGQTNLILTFEDRFYKVNGNSSIDSTQVINYMNQFQFFEANEMISEGRMAELDSLLKQPHLAKITISDIKYTHPIILKIYPKLSGKTYHLVWNESSLEMMVIDEQRIANLLKSVEDFII